MTELDLEIKKYRRSRRLRILVKPGGKVVVTAPLRTPKYLLTAFLEKNKNWIKEAQGKMAQVVSPAKKGSPQEYKKYKNFAFQVFSQRLLELNRAYNFQYKKVSVKNQASRWGSCSKSGTLSFNYRLVFFSKEVMDYVLVHELCHLAQMNHSSKFWALVEKTIPNYKLLRKQLKNP